MKYAWIEQQSDNYPIAVMSRVLGVSRSGYYDSLSRSVSSTEKRRETIAEAAQASYQESYGIYGYRKVYDDLREQEISCCRETVRKVMRERRLFSRAKRRFVVTTDSNHTQPVAGNILDRDFVATRPDQKWTADITYIPTREGWLYLAIVLDLFSRKIVGWSVSGSLETKIVSDALRAALSRRHPEPGLLHHSDRGSQYASRDFQELLDDHGVVCSMSRRGDCYDNAPTESFFGKLKQEWVHGEDYVTRAEATRHIFAYIELFYNRRRKHAAIGYRSPEAFEQEFYESQQQAA